MNAAMPLSHATPTLDAWSRPLLDVRISLLDQCNFRCPYCMPAGISLDAMVRRKDWLTADEIERFVRTAVDHGVRKVRLTGGEPLLRTDLEQIIARIARVDATLDLALTTNGALLGGRAAALRDAGLRRLTISLDALDPQRFREMSGGRGEVSTILEAIESAERAGFQSLKINCVIERGRNEDQVLLLAGHFRGTPHSLRFIEYMDAGTCNGWRREQVVPSAELRDRIAAVWPLLPVQAARRGEVATRWRYVDGLGEIGFISSISQPFCGDCTRLRLGADGRLYTCLFARTGTDVRPLLAAGFEQALSVRLGSLWRGRRDRYSELRDNPSQEVPSSSGRVEMYRVGG